MTEKLLDVRGSARVIARSWRIAVLFMLIGLLASVGYLVKSPPGYKATALVLLPPSTSLVPGTSSSASRPVTADAKVATSAAVLLPAAEKVEPSASLGQLQSRVTASTVASGVLQISATASHRRDAEELANAVASRLVAFVTANGSGVASSVIAGLRAEETQLESQLADVQKQATATSQRIATEAGTSSLRQEDGALLANLTSQESSIALQISSVKSQIASSQTGQISANLGTEVIQRATFATAPSLTSYALPMLMGIVGGGLIGSFVILATNRARPRVWTRDGLAVALGAPVVLSLDVAERRSLGDWAHLFENHDPGPLERWNVLKALREFGAGSGEHCSIVVLALDGDRPAIAEAVQVAVAAAASGVVTELSVLAAEGVVDTLQAACARYGREDRQPRPHLTVRDGLLDTPQNEAELSVTVVVPDIQNIAGSIPAAWPAGICVVSISAGFASADELDRVGMAATGNGTPIKGICVANPEARDDTVGRFASMASTRSLEHHRQHRHTSNVAMERSR